MLTKTLLSFAILAILFCTVAKAQPSSANISQLLEACESCGEGLELLKTNM